jgi:hypothetical protein
MFVIYPPYSVTSCAPASVVRSNPLSVVRLSIAEIFLLEMTCREKTGGDPVRVGELRFERFLDDSAPAGP